MSEGLDFLRPRLLGIDYGEARIGLALSDELGFLAHPLETIDRRKSSRPPEDRVFEVVQEKRVAKIILGIPLRMDGTEGPSAQKVRAFFQCLEKRLPEIPIELVDERLTTVDAQAQLHAAGRNVKNSRAVIDQAAAVVILQEYLDRVGGLTFEKSNNLQG